MATDKTQKAFNRLDHFFGTPANQKKGFPSEDAAAHSAATLLAAQLRMSYGVALKLVHEWYRREGGGGMRDAGHVVADFSTLDDLISHAGGDDATHVSGSEASTKIFYPRGGQFPYEEATVWRKNGYWHAQGPGSRTGVTGLPRDARPIGGAARRAAEPRRHRTHEDYTAIDSRDRTIAGPFKQYSDAKGAAGPGGHVKFVPAGRRASEAGSSNMNFQAGDRLRIRVIGPQGQLADPPFWYTVPYVIDLEEVALQFAQTIQPGMFVSISDGKNSWTFKKETHAGQNAVRRTRKLPTARYREAGVSEAGRPEPVDDPFYIIQGLYNDGSTGGGFGEFGFDEESDAIAEAKTIARSSWFEGDYVRVITRDGEEVWDSRGGGSHPRKDTSMHASGTGRYALRQSPDNALIYNAFFGSLEIGHVSGPYRYGKSDFYQWRLNADAPSFEHQFGKAPVSGRGRTQTAAFNALIRADKARRGTMPPSQRGASEARGEQLPLPGIDEHRGERYASEQLEGEYFHDWAWGQMIEGVQMRKKDPSSVIPLSTEADYQRLARRMLQDMEFDVRRDTNESPEFFQGLRNKLTDRETVKWLGDELMHMQEQIDGGAGKKKKGRRGPKARKPAKRTRKPAKR